MIETSIDWKIHKKLDEARTVYVYPARGNGKYNTQLRVYQELFETDKNIKFVYDRIKQLTDECLKEHIRKSINNETIAYDAYEPIWKPVIEPDTYIYDAKRVLLEQPVLNNYDFVQFPY